MRLWATYLLGYGDRCIYHLQLQHGQCSEAWAASIVIPLGRAPPHKAKTPDLQSLGGGRILQLCQSLAVLSSEHLGIAT